MSNTKRKRDLLTPPADNDGDSTMHSSADDDEMFPDEALPNNPATPMHASVANLAAPAELSPPNSQGGPSVVSRDTTALSSTVNANGKRPLSLAQTASSLPANTHTDPETGYSWTKPEEKPGWEWKNTRAREEENRALDSMVDLGAQIKLRYGDPLDPSVPAKSKS